MTLEDKIQYIIDNDGSEGADYFQGLQTFLKCLTESKEEKDLLQALEPVVDYWYEMTKTYIEEEEDWKFIAFKDLPSNCIIYTSEDNRNLLIKIKNKLYDQDGNLIPVHKDAKFLIHTTIYPKETSRI